MDGGSEYKRPRPMFKDPDKSGPQFFWAFIYIYKYFLMVKIV